MKRRFIVGIAVLSSAVVCVAQVNGVPASVSSPTNSGGLFSRNGIPAGVGSLGPQGYSPVSDNFVPVGPPRRDRLGRVVLAAPIPLYYYGYPLVYLPVEPPANTRRVSAPQYQSEPQKIIVEIRDTRPPAPVAKEVVAEKAPAAIREERRAEVELPRVATVFIFRDGSRKDLKDFAITPTELIDLSEGLIRRSPLDALDRAATLKANADQGVELHFPAAASD